jgi:Fe-S cluster biogenesis protein NfuA
MEETTMNERMRFNQAEAEQAGNLDAIEKEEINPLIDSDGDTYRVSNALEAVALLVGAAADGNVSLTQTANHGISILLDTCAAALRKMQEAKQ